MTTGKDKGKSGTVMRAMPKTDSILIDGVNVVKRHEKARKRGSTGQIIEHPMPIHVSNVSIKDKKSGKPARVGYIFESEGEKRNKVRVTRPSGEHV